MSYIDDIPRHGAGDKCPGCNAYDKPRGGILREIKSKFGKPFLGCNRYPDCKYTVSSFYNETQTVSVKKKRNQFKKDVPKKLRKEWGQRASHLRAIIKEI